MTGGAGLKKTQEYRDDFGRAFCELYVEMNDTSDVTGDIGDFDEMTVDQTAWAEMRMDDVMAALQQGVRSNCIDAVGFPMHLTRLCSGGRVERGRRGQTSVASTTMCLIELHSIAYRHARANAHTRALERTHISTHVRLDSDRPLHTHATPTNQPSHIVFRQPFQPNP